MSAPPILPVRAAIGHTDLIGAIAGKHARARLVEAAAALPPGPWLGLDFDGIDMVSASAAREAFLVDLPAHLHERGTLPVLLALNNASLEEVVFAAQALRLPIVVADGLADGEPAGLRILGELDSKLRLTLSIVARLGEADAKTAFDEAKDDSTGVTAWNNRLSSLAGMRLLKERKSGKTKYYSLTLKGLVDGN